MLLLALSEAMADRPTDPPTDRPSNQLINQPTHRPTIQPTNQPTDRPTNQLINRPTDQPTSQPTNRREGSKGSSASKAKQNMGMQGPYCKCRAQNVSDGGTRLVIETLSHIKLLRSVKLKRSNVFERREDFDLRKKDWKLQKNYPYIAKQIAHYAGLHNCTLCWCNPAPIIYSCSKGKH